ncbi:Hypothetical protein NTJ_13444 [Nesidiocoris tenuis]|uniref:Uncharacterized protein n=1 Tax=Nesidiocoris tenuis TaxID=355587 RepID=A0ABN7B8C0_9HEMI|nr:Hypothetical protein NTJ_13444 [Nesidiocoris tenuis]
MNEALNSLAIQLRPQDVQSAQHTHFNNHFRELALNIRTTYLTSNLQMWWLWLVVGVAVSAAGSIVKNSDKGPAESIESALQGQILEDALSGYNALTQFPYYSSGTQHLVSPLFPGIDSKGLGDNYPSWPSFYYNKIQRRGLEDNTVKPPQRNKRSLISASSSKRDGIGKIYESVNRKTDNDDSTVISIAKRGRSGGRRIIRGMEMGSSGFHDDIFNSGFGDFYTMKRSQDDDTTSPSIEGLKSTDKRRPEMDAMGFHGDTFGGGFGEFETMKKKRLLDLDAVGFLGDTFGGEFDEMTKRKTGNANHFRGDYKRNWPVALGFQGNMIGYRFGDFDVLEKRTPESSAMGFQGDMLNNGFGQLDPMKKRSTPHGKTASKTNVAKLMPDSGFIEKLNRPNSHFKQREHFTKRRPEMDSMGFHGGMFSQGFGDFETMKRFAQSVHGTEKF